MKTREWKLNNWIVSLLGSRDEFSASARLFHAVNISTCLLLLIVIPFNIILGLYSIGWLLLFLLFAHAGVYFLSRVKKRFLIALAGVVFLAYSGATVNYYFNSGIDGPTLFIFFFTFLLLVAVTRRRYHIIYFALTCVVAGGLLYYDHSRPGWIRYSFDRSADRYIDIYFVFILILLFIYIITRSLIDSYHYERNRANQRALDLQAKNAELERVDIEKQKLFSIIFHDLKSPLASVQMYLEMIELISLSPAEERRIRAELHRQTKETLAILDNTLLWTKDQVEKKAPKLTYLNIGDVVNSCVRMESPFARAKGVDPVVSVRAETMVLADGHMLAMVLRILINNAIKFTPKGTTVWVDVYEQDCRCVVKVKDSGAGVPPEEQPRIFSLGIESTEGTNSEKGSGLGLALAHEFAKRQGIDIWFESRPGKGAEFFLALPVQGQQGD